MLRGTAGTNNFNNPNLSLSIDGKMSAMDIQLKAQGRSPEEIRNNLTATAG